MQNTAMPKGSRRSVTGFPAPLILRGKVKKTPWVYLQVVHKSFAVQSSLILRSCDLLFNQYSDKYIFKVEYNGGKNTKLLINFSWKHAKNSRRFKDVHIIVLF